MVIYRHFSLEERWRLAELHRSGASLRQIAAALDRSPSSISRELKRNSGSQVGYQPRYADDCAWARRWSGSRLERDAALRTTVLDHLARGWSPEQVAGRLALEAGHPIISYESIYRFVEAQTKRTDDYGWRRYLPLAKFKRGRRKRKGRAPVIKNRTPITERPPSVADRAESGHWEGDTLLFKTYGQTLLAAQERSSRLLLLARQPSKASAPVAKQLIAWLKPIPASLRQTITFDNGTEFAQHQRLTKRLNTQTFFCNTHSPWQKGGIENAIGRLRRYLPRKTNLNDLSTKNIQACANAYNLTPRKCLGYQTPAEVFAKHLLHFECESTS
ncbi:IS30 family transposase [Sphingoaurantiacus capsulatus]|uniref:IS30 family transposase n=1 Tax=Sphingoaurantiacus capsulatus TaxID=1771310 RepID=A0ABV7XCT9_9SPHN